MDEQQGFGFAAARAHALHMGARRVGKARGDWTLPGLTFGLLPDDGWLKCACGEQYEVVTGYHYHSIDGKCHNAVRCI